MASPNQRNDDQPTFSTDSPQVFTIISTETQPESKLQLPTKFVRKYGDTLSNFVSIKLPCCSQWINENKIWLNKGWSDFSKYYTLEYGSCLVFKYEGIPKFYAFIFNKTTMQIDYPHFHTHFDEHNTNDDEEDDDYEDDEDYDDDDDEDDEEYNDDEDDDGGGSHKRMRITQLEDGEETKRRKKPMMSADDKAKRKGRLQGPESGKNFNQGESSRGQITPMPFSKPPNAFEACCNFTSTNPFFFTILLVSSLKDFVPGVWDDFARKHLENKTQDVTLVVGEKSWKVKMCEDSYDFTTGWSTFAGENSLSFRDACVFELIRKDNVVFKVTIFRANYP